MNPYYNVNGITIYHGDCLDVLPTLQPKTIDLVLTDPPYGIQYVTARRSRTDQMVAPIIGDTCIPIDWLPIIKGLSRSRTALYWFTREEGIETVRQAIQSIGFGLNTMLVWDKQVTTAGNLKDYGRRTEYIVFGTNGSVRLNGNRDGNLLSVPRVNPNVMVHPTEKPRALLSYLILRSTDPAELVLDPFMGSGSALVAAAELGRHAIGIEIDERYCEIAAQRLTQGMLVL